jgi:hypothetical protein
MIPKPKPQSPTRFITKAFKAARLALIREYQKLIRRKEHKPTPSHPKKAAENYLPKSALTYKT